jgi:hypothetical protein
MSLAFGDLLEIGERERNPVAVPVERDLTPVGAGPQRALGHPA